MAASQAALAIVVAIFLLVGEARGMSSRRMRPRTAVESASTGGGAPPKTPGPVISAGSFPAQFPSVTAGSFPTTAPSPAIPKIPSPIPAPGPSPKSSPGSKPVSVLPPKTGGSAPYNSAPKDGVSSPKSGDSGGPAPKSGVTSPKSGDSGGSAPKAGTPSQKTGDPAPHYGGSAPKNGDSAPKDGESSPKDGESSPKDGESSPKDGESSPKDGESSPKDGESSPKDGESSPKDGESSPKDGESSPKDGESSPKDGESSPKDGESSPKDGESSPKDGESSPKDGESAPKDGESAPKDGESAPKDGESAPKDGESAPKDGESAPKDGESAPKDGESAPKDGDSAKDGKVSSKDGKDSPRDMNPKRGSGRTDEPRLGLNNESRNKGSINRTFEKPEEVTNTIRDAVKVAEGESVLEVLRFAPDPVPVARGFTFREVDREVVLRKTETRVNDGDVVTLKSIARAVLETKDYTKLANITVLSVFPEGNDTLVQIFEEVFRDEDLVQEVIDANPATDLLPFQGRRHLTCDACSPVNSFTCAHCWSANVCRYFFWCGEVKYKKRG